MWIFLLAGHETTAHTLAFLLTLLALYPEHQQMLYDEAKVAGEHTTYSDFTSFVRLVSRIPPREAGSSPPSLSLRLSRTLSPRCKKRCAYTRPCSSFPRSLSRTRSFLHTRLHYRRTRNLKRPRSSCRRERGSASWQVRSITTPSTGGIRSTSDRPASSTTAKESGIGMHVSRGHRAETSMS